MGSFGTLLTGLGLWALRRARNYIEKRCRGVGKVIETTNEAASRSGSDTTEPPSDVSTPELAPNPFLSSIKTV